MRTPNSDIPHENRPTVADDLTTSGACNARHEAKLTRSTLTGLIIAVVASTRGGRETSECAWYFVAFTFDTTLGVALAVAMHRLLVRAAKARLAAAAAADIARAVKQRSWAATIAVCGDYGAAPSRQYKFLAL